MGISESIKNDLLSLNTVSGVDVQHKHDDIYVEVRMSAFDRQARYAVYAKQKALYREFPNLSFDFALIDESQVASRDAIAR